MLKLWVMLPVAYLHASILNAYNLLFTPSKQNRSLWTGKFNFYWEYIRL